MAQQQNGTLPHSAASTANPSNLYNPYTQASSTVGPDGQNNPHSRRSSAAQGPGGSSTPQRAGDGPEADFSASAQSSFPHSIPPFGSNLMFTTGYPNLNPDLYPSTHLQRQQQQQLSYGIHGQQQGSHGPQAQDYSVMQGGGQQGGNRFEWATTPSSHRPESAKVGEGFMFNPPAERGLGGHAGDPRLPRTATPVDPYQLFPSSAHNTQGDGSSQINQNLSSAYDAWGSVMANVDPRLTQPWGVQPLHAGPSGVQLVAPLPTMQEEPSRPPPPAKSARVDNATESQSDTGGSRPSTAGVQVKKEPGGPSRKGSMTAKARRQSTGQAQRKKEEEDPNRDGADGDGEEDDDMGGEDESKMDHRKRKRNRTIRSCVPCHNHKRKCDRQRPCSRCTALALTGSCVYEVDEARDQQDPSIAEEDRLRRRVAELEQVVRELRQRQPPRTAAAGSSRSRATTPILNISDADEVDKVGQDNKKRRVIVDRYARFKIDEAAMAEVAAAAAAAGSTVASGSGTGGTRALSMAGPTASGMGVVRDKRSASDGDTSMAKAVGKEYMGELYKTSLLPGEEIVFDRSGRKTFLGAPAGKSMLRRLRELMSAQTPETLGEARSVALEGEEDLLSVPDELAFTGWFPDVRKTFPFTTIWSHENFSGEIIGLLPNKQQAELLLQSWHDEICAFFVAWHTPTLEAGFRRFFTMTTLEKMNVPLSSLSVYLMICALGCVVRASKSEIFGHPDRAVAIQATSRGLMPDRDPKDLTASRLQSELYLSASYQALRLCSFMSNPTIYTIQAQILINVYLLNSERAADAWSQIGALVRQCIAMGLHKDPLSLDGKISMRDAEVRRRIWWTVAGLDALFCVSFGRPSSITFYTTNLPQDRTDDNLSEVPGSAAISLPPSNVLNNETTDMTYHAAYYQLTIPSLELLDRIFRIEWNYSRSAIYGWFSRRPDSESATKEKDEQVGHTYEDAIRLAQDILQWYSLVPRHMRFESEEDTAESLTGTRSTMRVNQTLALCVKTFMIVMILHRPYLRADPAAYPESSEICFRSAKVLLAAYAVGSKSKASIFWSWWTMSFRAFHAGAVCAFLAIREPNTELATNCLASLRGAIAIFEDRISSWNIAHPVQADLCHGLVKLQKLAVAATQQRRSPSNASTAQYGTTIHHSPLNDFRMGQGSNSDGAPERTTTPLSQIKGFPAIIPPSVSPNLGHPASGSSGHTDLGPPAVNPAAYTSLHTDPYGLLGDGFNGPEQLAYPQMWASMFGIKVDSGELSDVDMGYGGGGQAVPGHTAQTGGMGGMNG